MNGEQNRKNLYAFDWIAAGFGLLLLRPVLFSFPPVYIFLMNNVFHDYFLFWDIGGLLYYGAVIFLAVGLFFAFRRMGDRYFLYAMILFVLSVLEPFLFLPAVPAFSVLLSFAALCCRIASVWFVILAASAVLRAVQAEWDKRPCRAAQAVTVVCGLVSFAASALSAAITLMAVSDFTNFELIAFFVLTDFSFFLNSINFYAEALFFFAPFLYLLYTIRILRDLQEETNPML